VADETNPVHFIVDIDRLSAARDQVSQLRADLKAATEISVWEELGNTGDSRVPQAVERFLHGWRDGRDRIDEKLGDVHALLTFAIDTYIKADATIESATRPTDTAP